MISADHFQYHCAPALDPNQGGSSFGSTIYHNGKQHSRKRQQNSGQLRYKIQTRDQYMTGYNDTLVYTLIVEQDQSSARRDIDDCPSRS